MSSERTLVLNSGYQVVGVVPWQRAITMLYEGDAETLHDWDKTVNDFKAVAYDKEVANQSRSYVYKLPAIVRLLNSNVLPRHRNVKFSKINVFYRDDYTCQYCGHKSEHGSTVKNKRMTIDHVIPVSKGGRTTFDNCVAACGECNSKKSDKTLAEAGLKLLKKPSVPSVSVLLKRKLNKKRIHASWEKFLNNSTIMV